MTSVGGRRAGAFVLGCVLGVSILVGRVPSASAVPAAAAPAGPHTLPYADGTPRDARLTIPALGLEDLRVVAYRGVTDDGPGTRIQDRGIAASPYGPHGGTGPGSVGNYQVTAHRTVHGGVFRRTPTLRIGARVLVDAGPWRYVYRITETRWVSFRSAASLRAQRAPVPGHPGRTVRHGYITVSTCATPEDHAAGDYWHDRFGNPEHRIDKVGVLVRRLARPAGAS